MTGTTLEQLVAIGTVDLLVGLPGAGQNYWEERIRRRLTVSDPAYERHLAPYLYKSVPTAYKADLAEASAALFDRMSTYGIDKVLVAVDPTDTELRALVAKHPDRLIASVNVDPTEGMAAVHRIRHAAEDFGARGVNILPCAYTPSTPIDDRAMFPVYAKCAELGLPVFISVGVPGPRVPMTEQRVELVDAVCHFFPELTIVLRHGGLPWIDLAIQLVLKWPNLYYSTSAIAPEYWSAQLVQFANSRGREKVLFSGYYPFGLDYDRVFRAMCQVDFRPEVWPLFLRENALRVLAVS